MPSTGAVPQVILIMGARRTGTTLMNQILCNDPRANPHVAECQLLVNVCDNLRWSENNYDRVVRWYFSDRADALGWFRRCTDDFLRTAAANLGNPSFLVLKAPAFSQCKQQLDELLPQARSVVCVRNPFDQVVSELDVGERQIQKGIHAKAAEAARNRDVKMLAERYASVYEKLLPQLGARDLIVRYEDLINNLDGELSRLEAHTGLDLGGYDPASAWKRFEHKSELARMPAHVEQYGSPLDKSRVGRFEHALSAAEVDQIRQVCGPLLARFYPAPVIDPPRGARR